MKTSTMTRLLRSTLTRRVLRSRNCELAYLSIMISSRSQHPIARAVGEASDAQQSRGATIEPFEPLHFEAAAIGCYLGIMSADGGPDLRRLLRSSRVNSRLRQTLFRSRISQPIRQTSAIVLSAVGQSQWAFALRNSGPRSADFAWRLENHRQIYTQ